MQSYDHKTSTIFENINNDIFIQETYITKNVLQKTHLQKFWCIMDFIQ